LALKTVETDKGVEDVVEAVEVVVEALEVATLVLV
jgi:hypothetical protein